MQCEYCGSMPHGDIAVELYLVGGKSVMCCNGCIDDNLPFDDRVPVNMPDGWELMPSDALSEVKKGNEAFMAMENAMRAFASNKPIRYGYVYDGELNFANIVEYLEKKHAVLASWMADIGLRDINYLNRAAAYCPNCKSLMLTFHSIKFTSLFRSVENRNSFSERLGSDSSDVYHETTRKIALVCLGCQMVYLDDKKRK